MSFIRCATAVVVGTLLLAAPAWCDEAVRTDGRRVAGTIALDAAGHLRFTPKGQADPLPADAVQSYRFSGSPQPCRFTAAHQVVLADNQHFTAQLLGLDATGIRLRTTWAAKIELPRTALAALRQIPGQRTVLDDDLARESPAWTVAGKPVHAGAVLLSAAGQSLTHRLKQPLNRGHIAITFDDRESASGARWFLEATFAGEKTPQRLRVVVAGPDNNYRVETDGLDGVPREVKRTAGPHRLTVRFHAHSLVVLCDDEVLWHNLERGPAGPLQSVRLACLEGEKGAMAKGKVTWSEFTLTAAVDELQRPPGDPSQDEIWLTEGDQVFGTVTRADRSSVTIRGAFGEKPLPWSAVRGCFFKGAAAGGPQQQGERVRLLLHSPNGGEPDVLHGVITRLDEKTVTLRHAVLGEIKLERGRVKEVRP